MKPKKFLKGGEIALLTGLGMMGYDAYKNRDKTVPTDDKYKADESSRDPYKFSVDKQAPSVEKKRDPNAQLNDYRKITAEPEPEPPKPAPVIKTRRQNTKTKPYTGEGMAGNKPNESAAETERKVMGVNNKSTSGFGPRNTFLTEERSNAANKSVGRGWREQNPGLAKAAENVKKFFKSGDTSASKGRTPLETGDELIRRGKEDKRRRDYESRYKKGGSVSSASKRADGIAQRGKTRGRVF